MIRTHNCWNLAADGLRAGEHGYPTVTLAGAAIWMNSGSGCPSSSATCRGIMHIHQPLHVMGEMVDSEKQRVSRSAVPRGPLGSAVSTPATLTPKPMHHGPYDEVLYYIISVLTQADRLKNRPTRHTSSGQWEADPDPSRGAADRLGRLRDRGPDRRRRERRRQRHNLVGAARLLGGVVDNASAMVT